MIIVIIVSSIGRCWNCTELCSNLLATNHLWKVVRHQNALDFHLLIILANIRLKLMGKVEDREKRYKELDLPEEPRVIGGDKGDQDTRNYQTNDHFPEKNINIKC